MGKLLDKFPFITIIIFKYDTASSTYIHN